MASVSPSAPPEPTVITTEWSTLEEGKVIPSEASTTEVTVSPIHAHKIIAELVGTYVIIFVGCGSIIIDATYQVLSIVGVAVAWGLAVMLMIYALGHVSGSHFNPAITIGFAASCKFPWKQVPGYVAAQLAGSTLAVLTLNVVFHHKQTDIKITTTQFQGYATDLEAFMWEFITSFILMLSICGVAVDNRAINELSGVVVGAAVLFEMLISGKITGASMNPARSIGPALVSNQFQSLWVYIFAPILGMITASKMYSLLWLPAENFDTENTKNA